MIERIKNYFDKHALKILMILTVTLSIVSLIWVYFNNYILLYADAYFHLNISRRIIDGVTAGFSQIGTVWLPLPHIITVPFIINDNLWRSGIAGSFPSMICFVLSAVVLFKIIKIISDSNLLAFLGGLMFILNPNILYLQSVPMTELLFIFMMLSSIYFLIKWINKEAIIYLVTAASFVCLATLTRYEGWFLAFVESVIVVIMSLKYNKNSSFKKAEGNLLIFLTLSSLGMILWVFWNWAIWGNPLEFLNGQYSAHAQQLEFFKQGRLLTKGNIILSLKTFFWAVANNVGFLYMITLIIAIPLFVFKNIFLNKNRINKILNISLFILLISPAIFHLISLYNGNSIMFVSEVFPDEKIFNIRYGSLLLPAIIILITSVASKNIKLKIFIIILILLQSSVFLYTKKVVSFQDGFNGMSSANFSVDAEKSWDYLMDHYNKKKDLILAGALVNDIYIPHHDIVFKNIVHEGSYGYWQKSLIDPSKNVQWVIMQRDDFDPVYRNLENNIIFHERFRRVFYSGIWSVWRLKDL